MNEEEAEKFLSEFKEACLEYNSSSEEIDIEEAEKFIANVQYDSLSDLLKKIPHDMIVQHLVVIFIDKILVLEKKVKELEKK